MITPSSLTRWTAASTTGRCGGEGIPSVNRITTFATPGLSPAWPKIYPEKTYRLIILYETVKHETFTMLYAGQGLENCESFLPPTMWWNHDVLKLPVTKIQQFLKCVNLRIASDLLKCNATIKLSTGTGNGIGVGWGRQLNKIITSVNFCWQHDPQKCDATN